MGAPVMAARPAPAPPRRRADAAGALFGRDFGQLAGLFHALVQRDRIEIEAVGPGGRAHFDEDTREIGRVFQRLDHRARLGNDARQIVHAFAAVGKSQPEAVTVQRFEAQHVDHLDVIHRHRDLQPSPKAGAPGRAANFPPIRRAAPFSRAPCARPAAAVRRR